MSVINGVFPAASLPSAVNSGLATISVGTQRLSQDAQQIAAPDGSSTGPLLDLTQSKLIEEAGAAVIRTSNSMLGSLLDAFA